MKSEYNKEFAKLEAYIRDIWKFLPLPLIYITPLGVLVDCDEAFESLIDIPKEDIIGESVDRFFTCNDPVENIFKKTVTEGCLKDVDCKIRHRNGDEIPVIVSSLARKDKTGETIGFFMAFTDISERTRSELTLRASEEKYRAAVKQSAENIYIVDIQTKRILEANSSLQNLLGYTEQELESLTAYDFIAHPQEDIDKKVADVIDNKRVFVGERQYKCKDGSIVDVEVSASYITYGDKEALSVVSRNISRRKKMEAELKKNYDNLQRTIDSTVRAMSRIVETRDPYTAGHQRRVARLAKAIAQNMGLSEEQINGIYTAALIHDIGKLYIPAEILVKPTALSAIEFEMVKTHPAVGYNILKTIEFPWPVATIVLQHHERINGSGYPHGRSNGDILIEARILALADVVEAMSSHRPYRPAKTLDETIEEIIKNRQILYDADAVDLCVELFKNKLFSLNET
jgi:PAS domain S-box-containing protein/putative nucleotidyltransferase with HDIG domain